MAEQFSNFHTHTILCDGKDEPEALVQVCGLAKYKFRLTLAAGEIPMLKLKLKPGADVLETALELVEDLKLAGQPVK